MLALAELGTLCISAGLSVVLAGTVSPELRQRAESVCFNDASRLCSNAMADEGQIVSCMKGKRDLLTVPCRMAFDEVARALK